MHVASPAAERLIESGRQWAAKADLDKAIGNFTEAIRLDPDLPAAYTERGQAFFKRNEFERAIEDFTTALAVNDSYAPALRGRGMAQLYRGDNDPALDDLTKAIQLAESDSAQLSPLDLFGARRSRAALYGAMFQYEGQIADCTAIIQSYRNDPAVREDLNRSYGLTATGVMVMIYRQRANAYLQQANPEAALADLTTAIEFGSDRFAILLDRARVYELLGARDQGLADANAALRFRPDNGDAKALRKRLSAGLKSPSSS
jgi:tetratricopeptide (TPR) repeat protein